jgi:hypothetical protein
MQCIKTKYLGPTNNLGARIKASCDAKSKLFAWDYGLGIEENHLQAAEMLRDSLGWTGPLKQGWLKHEAFHVFLD